MEAKVENRNRVIIRFNIAGIVMNLLLSAAKLIIGLKINSRAVMLDAVNGFSDMATSVLSILSTLFGGKRVVRTHPFGYVRLEYITSMFGSVLSIDKPGVRTLLLSGRSSTASCDREGLMY